MGNLKSNGGKPKLWMHKDDGSPEAFEAAKPINVSGVDLITGTGGGSVPVRKGCKNKECFCTGECQKIIGYRDKLPGEL